MHTSIKKWLPAEMQIRGKQICSREGTSANYGEACKERFFSLRSASVEVVCSRPFAPHLCFQTCLIIRLPPFFYNGDIYEN